VTTTLWVVDHTALMALFSAHREVMALWELADQGEAMLVMPAAAVAEASHHVGADDNAWRALLHPANVQIAPLDGAAAIGSSAIAGSLAARHVAYEARTASGIIVTRAPLQYPSDVGPLRVV
jgi:hypothetical protein